MFFIWVCSAESFKLTCDFGQGWDEFTPRFNHIIIDDKVYFEEKIIKQL